MWLIKHLVFHVTLPFKRFEGESFQIQVTVVLLLHGLPFLVFTFTHCMSEHTSPQVLHLLEEV